MSVEAPTAPARSEPTGPAVEPAGPFAGPFGTWAAAAVAVVVAAAVVLRFATRSALWEDEALTVAIANRPLSQLRTLLSHDGSPPLYYALLHVWMRVFGHSDLAVRSLSGVLGVASLPLAWLAGRRAGGRGAGGRWVAWSAVVVIGSSPYAIRYSTEARMYGLEIVLGLIGYLALANALERPTLLRLGGVAAVTGLLLYTHYWTEYLVLTVSAALFVVASQLQRREAWRVLGAIAAGCLLFIPWLPTWLYQYRHTGTPWQLPTAPAAAIYQSLNSFAGFQNVLGFSNIQERLSFTGPKYIAAYVLLFCIDVLVLLALFGRAVDGRHIDIDLRTQRRARPLCVAAGATLLVGTTLSYFADTAFQFRYVAGVFALVAVIVALGVVVFADHRVRYGALALVVVCGFVVSADNVTTQRTQAPQAARVLDRRVQPGDVVVFCPDQIGVATTRYLHTGAPLYAFPTLDRPDIVNWVDYIARNDVFHRSGVRGNLADAKVFAAEIVRRAGGHTVWYVSTPGYLLGDKCKRVGDALAALRTDHTRVLRNNVRLFENEAIERYAA